MNEPPCIINKCLKYPICKYKLFIECEELFIYFTHQIEQHYGHNNPLPRITNICLEYLICKHKNYTNINCKELHIFYKRFAKQLKQCDGSDNLYLYPKAFKHLKTIFPNIKGIIGIMYKVLPNIKYLYME